MESFDTQRGYANLAVSHADQDNIDNMIPCLLSLFIHEIVSACGDCANGNIDDCFNEKCIRLSRAARSALPKKGPSGGMQINVIPFEIECSLFHHNLQRKLAFFR